MNSVTIAANPQERKILRSVRLKRKLAESLNGINLSQISVGDTLELPDQTADMLIAEGWAELLMRASPERADSRGRRSRSSKHQKPR